ncbi:hypothetical protein BKA00_006137 [Actinomadura coerulea]|uniref:Uncharacterized protein n=1 Tax=Actinomadura coerulea TaxID=46159 RepID=A0A7X0G4D9_9ACTN|nr:hypothetical protein [Actinomadura coerulea]MBB6399223.1 hypothetical protein [Actinomadura coerulea]GGQ24216.1 hypothetical protein GCM10010187_45980 [Actinomadura coerulea]
MRTEPIHRGAECPQGRPPHALPSLLVRLVAVAGFAFAGWLALSALTHSAFAAERATRPAAAPDDHGLLDQTPRVANLDGTAAIRHLTTAPDHRPHNGHPGQGKTGQSHHNGSHAGQTRHDAGHAGHAGQAGGAGQGGQGRDGGLEGHDRHAGASAGGVPGSLSEAVSGSVPGAGSGPGLGSGPLSGAVAGGVREIGENPVTYLRARQQDVLDGKDEAVRQLRDVADEAGVPPVRVSDLLQTRPVIGDLVHRVTDQQPMPQDDAAPGAQPGPKERRGVGQERVEAAPAAEAHARSAPVPVAVSAGGPAHRSAEPCTGCRGDHRAPSPDPALPSGQDAPRGGGSAGGHPFAPVADLLNRQYPAAPSAADPGTFRRTALRDLAAPGGPSVVPD